MKKRETREAPHYTPIFHSPSAVFSAVLFSHSPHCPVTNN